MNHRLIIMEEKMNTNQKILIVGGVAGGASAAARLRRLDESANIIMFEKMNIYHLLTVVYPIILVVKSLIKRL